MNPLVQESAAAIERAAGSFSRIVEARAKAWVEQRAPEGGEERALLEAAVLRPLRAFLRRPGKLFRSRLVETAFEAGGGTPGGLPEILPVVVEAIHAGSLIVDDIQDDSFERRGLPCLHRTFGVPLAINTGNLLYCFAFDLIGEVELEPSAQLALYRVTSSALLRGHHGQALDLTARVADLDPSAVAEVVEASTRLKSGSLLELSASLGAVAAGASPEVRAGLEAFGRELGLGLQMLDDVSGLFRPDRRPKIHEDLRLGRPTWAFAIAAEALDPDLYAALADHAREVEGGADAEPLALRLAQTLAPHAKDRIHRRLRAALAGLRSLVGTVPAYLAIEAEVDRLERSFL